MTKEIELTQGKVALVDDEDYGRVSRHKWFAHHDGYNWYARRNHRAKQGRVIRHMHRDILGTGEGEFVHHINGNGLDNRKGNLVIATHAQNQAAVSEYAHNSSGYKGVSFDKSTQKWRAYIGSGSQGTLDHLGLFDDRMDAAKAYDQAAKERYGEFASLNLPDLEEGTQDG